MKIRLFALARELGLDSKVLLELCDEAGVPLRNALATITPEEREKIVAHVRNRDSATSGDAPSAAMAPVRDTAVDKGRVREIKTMAPRSVQSHTGAESADSDSTARDEDTPSETAATLVESGKPADAGQDTSSAESSVTASPVPEGAPTAHDAPEGQPAKSDDAAEVAADGRTPEVDAAPPVQPSRRPAMNPMREMKPIGSVKDRDQAGGKGGQKPRGARPLVAAPPTYTPPAIKAKQKPRDERVQKPDMALSDIVDRQSPLADQLQQLKRAQASTEAEGDARQKGRGRAATPKGALLKALRESRQAERQAKRIKRKRRSAAADLKTEAQISFPINIRNLSEAIGRPAKSIMSILFKEGRMVTINDELTEDEAIEIAMELGVDLNVKRGRDVEAELLASLDHDDPDEKLRSRPPIITILGHVDHGKTTLIDRLRHSNVTAGEAGGITQHIAAYQVVHDGRPLTFVDTPGHAAFGEMRSRGANVTDIIVLVVAADDGVMPQTEECISHARNAGVPIVVALNKMDLPGVDEQRTLQQLAQHDLLPAEWGGEYEVVRTSGQTGAGVDNLLETLLLTAELHEYKADPDREAIGVCLEAFRDEGRGVLAWLIVQKGTLRVGDNVLCGTSHGRIRAMYNDRDEEVSEAGPSTPVRVAGLNEVPGAGVHFFVMKDIEEAREVAENRRHEGRSETLSKRGQPRTLEDILSAAREGEGVQELPLIIKADTPGSLEALRGEIGKFDHPEVKVTLIHEAVGGVNESDVYLASAAEAIIIAFHVIAEERAEQLAEREGVEIRRYNIIYEVTEQIRQALEGLLRPERVEVATGRAIVLRTFQISRFGTIAGCRVINGTINRDNRVHVIRDQKVLNDYRISSLKREKDDAREVRDGMECGIRLEGFNDVKDGDLLEAFRIDEIQRTLS
ncbi:MAG: translation initiation factor IF-2 [Planctomycetaceae bacterium]